MKCLKRLLKKFKKQTKTLNFEGQKLEEKCKTTKSQAIVPKESFAGETKKNGNEPTKVGEKETPPKDLTPPKQSENGKGERPRGPTPPKGAIIPHDGLPLTLKFEYKMGKFSKLRRITPVKRDESGNIAGGGKPVSPFHSLVHLSVAKNRGGKWKFNHNECLVNIKLVQKTKEEMGVIFRHGVGARHGEKYRGEGNVATSSDWVLVSVEISKNEVGIFHGTGKTWLGVRLIPPSDYEGMGEEEKREGYYKPSTLIPLSPLKKNPLCLVFSGKRYDEEPFGTVEAGIDGLEVRNVTIGGKRVELEEEVLK